MNKNAELLNFVYQNSQMGVNTINQLLEITKNCEFKEHLAIQLEGYNHINSQARELLNSHGYDEKSIGTLDKIKTYLMINMQTLNDKSASHIASMMILGSDMGIIDAVKNINKYENAEKDIINLMEKLQKFEEQNIEKLKNFL